MTMEEGSQVEMYSQDEILNIKSSQAEDDKKLIQSFIMNIMNNTQGGCAFERIFSMLKTGYMVGQHINQDLIKEVLQGMILD